VITTGITIFVLPIRSKLPSFPSASLCSSSLSAYSKPPYQHYHSPSPFSLHACKTPPILRYPVRRGSGWLGDGTLVWAGRLPYEARLSRVGDDGEARASEGLRQREREECMAH
jgi:hypothetical protein